MIHIVFLKLKERTPENQKALVQILKKLTPETVPMVEKFRCGADFLGDDRSYDAALVAKLAKEDLQAYADDPFHCQIKAEMAPLLDHSKTVDFE